MYWFQVKSFLQVPLSPELEYGLDTPAGYLRQGAKLLLGLAGRGEVDRFDIQTIANDQAGVVYSAGDKAQG